MTRTRLDQLLKRMTGTKVLIIGDLILDEFIWGTVERISAEAPVPVVWVERESWMPGGAANVACNVRSLGGTAMLMGIVGQDGGGKRLKQELEGRGIPTEWIYTDPRRPTTRKTRVIAHHQQVVRIDRERKDRVGGSMLQGILDGAKQVVPQVDGVILEDYGKGLVQPLLLKPIIALAKKHKKVVTVDPKEENIPFYRGVTTLTPNKKEAAQAAGMPITDEASLYKAAQRIVAKTSPEVLLITLGEEGMLLYPRDGKKPLKIPTVAREVFDVSGAGDTVIATFTLARAAGASYHEAALIANAAAGVVVAKIGVATCSPEELRRQMFERPAADRRSARRSTSYTP